MKNLVLALVFAIGFGTTTTTTTAAAQSSFMDLSKPMTGTTRSVIHFDGRPVEFGVPLYDYVEQPVEGSGIGSSIASDGSRTVAVRSYTRKDGTFVQSHTRSAPHTSYSHGSASRGGRR